MKLVQYYVIIFSIIGILLMNCTSAEMPSRTNQKNSSQYSLSYQQIKMAAESGDPEAQYALGYMFYYGKGGVKRDISEAKRWIAKSAAQKQPQAIRALQLITGAEKPANNKNLTQTTVDFSSDQSNNKQSQEIKPSNEDSLSSTESDRVQKPNSETVTLVDMRKASHTSKNEPAVVDGHHYTLQLLGASHKQQIVKLIKQHDLGNQSKIYRTTYKNKDWYVLIYGTYKTKNEAHEAAKRLEKKFKIQPWVKPYSSIQKYTLMPLT
jgi:DamX protein